MTLIGTVHLDYEARSVLSQYLRMLRPGCVTVEISAFSVEYRTAFQDAWQQRFQDLLREIPEKCRRHPRIVLLERQISMPYEWMCAMEYAEDRGGIKCLAVDSDELAREQLPLWEETLLTRENLLSLIQEPEFELESHFLSCYQQARQVIQDPTGIPKAIHPLAWLADEFWMRRELILARRVREEVQSKGKVVHIGGWMHLVCGGPWKSMADLLEDLKPDCMLLNRHFQTGLPRERAIL